MGLDKQIIVKSENRSNQSLWQCAFCPSHSFPNTHTLREQVRQSLEPLGFKGFAQGPNWGTPAASRESEQIPVASTAPTLLGTTPKHPQIRPWSWRRLYAFWDLIQFLCSPSLSIIFCCKYPYKQHEGKNRHGVRGRIAVHTLNYSNESLIKS